MNPSSTPPPQNTDKHTSGFLAGLILGAFIGGFTSYLFSAPDGKKKMKEALEKSGELIGSIEDKIKESGGDLSAQLKDAYEEHIEELPDQIDQVGSAIKKRFFKKNGKILS